MLWEAIDDGHRIHVFGGGPPPAAAWSSPVVEALACKCEEFWNEVPALGADAQALALKYGIDPNAPLDTWLTEDDRNRLQKAALSVEANPALLAPLRPWLAAQIMKMALEARAGMRHEHTADAVLARRALASGARMRNEFPPPDGVFAYFAAMSREAEVEYLRFTLDDVEAGPEALRRDAQATAAGDLRALEDKTAAMQQSYPALHQALVVARNRAWVPRIRLMMANRTRAFIVVGAGHMVGPSGLLELLIEAGLSVERTEVR